MTSNIKTLLQKGFSMFNENKFEDAKRVFKQVLDLEKNNFESLHALGVINGHQGNHTKASEYFFDAHKLKPNDLTLNINLANSLLELGDNKNSIFFLDNAIKLNPKLSSIWYSKGVALKNLNHYEIAKNCFKQSLVLDKFNEKAYFNLGSIYRSTKQYDVGIKLLEEALNLFQSPQILEVFFTNLSNLHLDKMENQFGKDYSIVKEYSNKALSINSKNYIALNNLAMSNMFEKKYDLAAFQLAKVVEINQNFAPAFRNLGTLNNHLGNFKMAEKNLKSAITIEPSDVSKNFLLSEVLLHQNKFSEAWKYYEYRWEDTGGQTLKVKPKFTKPMWNPSLGFNINLVIWAEQGLGDMLLFSSIIPELVKKFKKIYLLIDKRLCRLLGESIPGLHVIDFSKPIDENFFDYQIPLCSLALFFRNSEEDFLVPKPLLKIKNQISINKEKNLRCGISWQSKGGLKSDKKNISIEALHPILKINNIEFFDIQYTPDSQENIDYKLKNNINFEKPSGLDTFNDIYGLAQFIDSCDFIVSTSNTNAHLSASLGKPTYLLLPKEYGRLFYWDNDKNNKNLWYPSIVKFNQIKQGDWSEPILQLSNFIKEKIRRL